MHLSVLSQWLLGFLGGLGMAASSLLTVSSAYLKPKALRGPSLLSGAWYWGVVSVGGGS
jgi:hypothetical protein